MNAIISGRSGTALMLDGGKLMSIHADAIEQLVPRKQADLPLLLGDGNDLQFFENVSFDEVANHLKHAQVSNDALELTLILLDSELSKGVRQEAAGMLEELFTDDKTSQYVQSMFYAHDLPNNADMRGAIEVCERDSAILVQSFLKTLHKLQPIIQKVSRAWDALPDAVFGSEEKRVKLHNDIIREGIFHNLVMKIARDGNVNTVHMSKSLKLSVTVLPEFEEVQRRWIELLRYEFLISEKSTEQKKIDTETQTTIQPVPIDREWIASRREAVKHYLWKKWNLNGDALEEVLQETMIAALQSFDKYEARINAEPGTYLIGIAKNVVQTYFRRRERQEPRRASL